MAIPDFPTLMLPVLQRVAQRRWKTAELIAAMAEQYNLTPQEREIRLPSGRQSMIANRTNWAITNLNKAGLIIRVAHGEYEVSDSGRVVVQNPPDKITVGFLKQFPPFVENKTDDGEPPIKPPLDDISPEERIEFADRDLKKELASTLLERVRKISPTAFEQLIIDLLFKMGYGGLRQEAVQHLGGPGDGGIDGLINEDALGLSAIYIQAKCYAKDNAVGAPDIQGFAGALLGKGATKGVFVTTSYFTNPAINVAAGYKPHRIILIDGEALARLMIAHEIGVRTVQTIENSTRRA